MLGAIELCISISHSFDSFSFRTRGWKGTNPSLYHGKQPPKSRPFSQNDQDSTAKGAIVAGLATAASP